MRVLTSANSSTRGFGHASWALEILSYVHEAFKFGWKWLIYSHSDALEFRRRTAQLHISLQTPPEFEMSVLGGYIRPESLLTITMSSL